MGHQYIIKKFIFGYSHLNGPIIKDLHGAYKQADAATAHGIVITQDAPILIIKRMSKLLRPVCIDPESIHPFAILAPTIPITWQCVVDAGSPVIDAIITRTEAVRTTENPMEGVILHIFVPIVSITFLPYKTSPKHIPIAPQTRIM